ncbi:MAG: hypothetical protein C5B58_13285 [Acidobacteria bacterium]|nr:MAG: hypothetical protein C5B58_13285 [Acidobacteriota bacterium]
MPDIPAELDLFSPEALSAFYEISFSNANIQRLMLENRLDAIRASSSLQSLGANPGGNAGLEKGSGDGKNTKNPVEPVLQPSRQYAFGLWATGFGDFVNLNSDFDARGYRFTSGGFDVGVDYRLLDHFAIGVVGNYAHTWTDLRPGTIGVNSGRGGLYAAYFNDGYYLNGGSSAGTILMIPAGEV